MFNHKGKNSSSDLNRGFIRFDSVIIIELDKSAEFAIIIKNQKLLICEFQMRVYPAHTDVTDPQIALMAPPQFQNLVGFRGDNGEGGVFVVNFLQNDVRTWRFLNGNYLLDVLLETHPPRQVLQTQLAF